MINELTKITSRIKLSKSVLVASSAILILNGLVLLNSYNDLLGKYYKVFLIVKVGSGISESICN